MAKWTYKTQLTLNIVILLCGFVLATVTKPGLFSNLGRIIGGVIFLIHPPVPEGAKWSCAGDERKMKRDGRIAGALVVLIGVITRFGV